MSAPAALDAGPAAGATAERVATFGTVAVLLTLGALLFLAPDAIPGQTTPGGGAMDPMVEPMGS